MMERSGSVELGRIDDARADIQALLAMRPDATISEVKRYLDFMPDPNRYLGNLRRAAGAMMAAPS